MRSIYTPLVPFRSVYLVAGMVDASTGKRLVGAFASEDDARSEDADSLAVAVLSADQLHPDDLITAEENAASI